MLQKISTEMEDFKAIKQTTASVEAKLSSLLTRVTEVEQRVSRLEDEAQVQKDDPNPPVKKSDMQDVIDRLVSAEDRSRQNNLRFVGFVQGVEGKDTIGFLNRFLAQALGINPPLGGFEIERAHRLRVRPNPNARDDETPPPPTIIAAFLRYQDRQRILDAARERKQILWEGKQVMIFPDFSRETMTRRAAFKDCKKEMHKKKMTFSLLYPALLSINVGAGAPLTFDIPAKAMAYISKR